MVGSHGSSMSGTYSSFLCIGTNFVNQISPFLTGFDENMGEYIRSEGDEVNSYP